MQPTQEQKDNWHKDPNNWKLGIFYYNPEDKRILPPKKTAWMGWTVNFANLKSVVLFLGILIFAFATTYFSNN